MFTTFVTRHIKTLCEMFRFISAFLFRYFCWSNTDCVIGNGLFSILLFKWIHLLLQKVIKYRLYGHQMFLLLLLRWNFVKAHKLKLYAISFVRCRICTVIRDHAIETPYQYSANAMCVTVCFAVCRTGTVNQS